jgi:hypothetical protein
VCTVLSPATVYTVLSVATVFFSIVSCINIKENALGVISGFREMRFALFWVVARRVERSSQNAFCLRPALVCGRLALASTTSLRLCCLRLALVLRTSCICVAYTMQ